MIQEILYDKSLNDLEKGMKLYEEGIHIADKFYYKREGDSLKDIDSPYIEGSEEIYDEYVLSNLRSGLVSKEYLKDALRLNPRFFNSFESRELGMLVDLIQYVGLHKVLPILDDSKAGSVAKLFMSKCKDSESMVKYQYSTALVYMYAKSSDLGYDREEIRGTRKQVLVDIFKNKFPDEIKQFIGEVAFYEQDGVAYLSYTRRGRFSTNVVGIELENLSCVYRNITDEGLTKKLKPERLLVDLLKHMTSRVRIPIKRVVICLLPRKAFPLYLEKCLDEQGSYNVIMY